MNSQETKKLTWHEPKLVTLRTPQGSAGTIMTAETAKTTSMLVESSMDPTGNSGGTIGVTSVGPS